MLMQIQQETHLIVMPSLETLMLGTTPVPPAIPGNTAKTTATCQTAIQPLLVHIAHCCQRSRGCRQFSLVLSPPSTKVGSFIPNGTAAPLLVRTTGLFNHLETAKCTCISIQRLCHCRSLRRFSSSLCPIWSLPFTLTRERNGQSETKAAGSG